MCDFLLKDLYAHCDTFQQMANAGAIVYQTNYTVNENTPSRWTIDLVVGPNASTRTLPGIAIAKANPSEVWLAIDAKAIMTEHGKARRNRQRDLNSMAEILHRLNPLPIAGAHVTINMSSQFRSPLREEVTHHRNIERIVSETVTLLNEILMDEEKKRPGLDAMGISVIDYSNLAGSPCRVIEAPPAPEATSPISYENFLAKICREFGRRFKK
jgi:hypothetical protein